MTACGHLRSSGHLSHWFLQELLSYKPQNQNGNPTHLEVQGACLLLALQVRAGTRKPW